MNDAKENAGKQVIARAAAVLRALEQFPAGASLAQLSRESSLPRTTVHRLVTALEAQGLVVADEGGVRLGPALARLAASAHRDVIATARPHIEALGRRTGETVDLCVYRGMHSVSVDQYPSNQELRVVSAIGTAFPIHCTAHGKALLMAMTDAEITSSLTPPLESRTPKTHCTLDALLADIGASRLRGHAEDREEHADGVCGIGLPLAGTGGERYALALAVPSGRFQARQDALRAALCQCQAEIEAALGAPGSPRAKPSRRGS